MRFDEVRQSLRCHSSAHFAAHRQSVHRHAAKAFLLAKGMAKESPQLAATVGLWLAAMFWATATGNATAISALTAVARQQACRLDLHTMRQESKQWEKWLHGDK